MRPASEADTPLGHRWGTSRAGRTLIWLVALLVTLAGCTTEQEPVQEASPPTAIQPVSPAPEPDTPAPPPSEPHAPPPLTVETPAQLPEPPEGRDELIGRLEQLVDDAVSLAGETQLAVLVTDGFGRDVVAYGADEAVLPASTLKVVTAAALLTTLGADATFTTLVETTAPIDTQGVLAGDLALIGSGDPVLATEEYGRWIYPARPRTPLAKLADDLVELGLTRVEGDIVGMAPGFTGPTRAVGWPDRYFSSFDARYTAGLTVDAGLRTIVVYPEPEDLDDEDDIADGSSESDPSGRSDVPEDEETDDPSTVDREDLGPPDVTVDHVLDPTEHAAKELVRLLREREVEVVGEGRSGELDQVVVGRLASVQSPPLEELLRFAVQRSDNQLTDGLFQIIGRVRTGEGSWEHGERALRQMLERFGIDHSKAVFADGSGLSRDDRVTARLLVDLDRTMTDSVHGQIWRSLMAEMGQSGTLRERLRGTVASGRFFGKTGTLRDVMALNGVVVDPDSDERFHLAVIANEAAGEGRWHVRELADELVLQLAATVSDCLVEPADRGDEPLTSLPRAAIRC